MLDSSLGSASAYVSLHDRKIVVKAGHWQARARFLRRRKCPHHMVLSAVKIQAKGRQAEFVDDLRIGRL